MAAALSPVAMGRKRASLEEVKAVHDRMLYIVELDKKLDVEMNTVASNHANWDKIWQSHYNELIEQLETKNLDLTKDEDSEEEYSSEEDMVVDENGSFKKPRNLSPSMVKKLDLLDKERTFRSRRIEYFKKYLDVESKRNEMLNKQAELTAQIKDLLEAELKSEEVLDPNQERERRAMIGALARWWDCLLYELSAELNDSMRDDEPGKWSQLYLKWRIWVDLKAGVFHNDEESIKANYKAS